VDPHPTAYCSLLYPEVNLSTISYDYLITRRANKRRYSRGLGPLPYTGWTFRNPNSYVSNERYYETNGPQGQCNYPPMSVDNQYRPGGQPEREFPREQAYYDASRTTETGFFHFRSETYI